MLAVITGPIIPTSLIEMFNEEKEQKIDFFLGGEEKIYIDGWGLLYLPSEIISLLCNQDYKVTSMIVKKDLLFNGELNIIYESSDSS